jgi:ABC-type nitrate/sulfonate/bicarbonate transport system substrate-binding protein
VFAAAAATVALAACGSSSSSSGGSSSTTATASASGSTSASSSGTSAPETSSLSLPSTAVSATDGPIELTIDQGIFKSFGLKVSVPLSAEAQVKSAVATGAAPLDYLAGSDAMDLYAKSHSIKTIGCTAPNVGFYLYAKKSLGSVSSLAGQTIGVPSLNGAPQFSVENALSKAGVAPSKVTFVPIGSIPDVLAALESGHVAAAALSTPFNLKAQAAGFTDLGYFLAPASPYVVNTKWAASNSGTITAFLKAFATGGWDYETNETAAEKVLAPFLQLDPSTAAGKAALAASYANYQPPVQEPIGECSASDFTPFVKFFPAAEQKQLANLAPMIDNSYVEQLAKSGFYQQLNKKYGPIKGVTVSQIISHQPTPTGSTH